MFKIFQSKNKTGVIPEEIKLDYQKMPKHIAIIMDGNGRWAKERNLPRTMGHKAGVETIRPIVKECSRLGVEYLTLYAFSTENWKRPQDEVDAIMNLLVQYLVKEFEELNKNNVVINSIGETMKLPEQCREELNKAYEKTKNNTGLTLNLALNYGGRYDLLQAFKGIMKEVHEGKINESEIDEQTISDHLFTAGMPDPDIIIRPSGELRLSNFLLWQCAYSELWFSDINWPDFKKEDLQKSIYNFQMRDRRFGKVK
ncbi:MAG TPA: isoprenyl transferase [Clostridiaceae bacterium]